MSIEPDIVTHKTIEMFEQRYVVKKDMLESPATAMIAANSSPKKNATVNTSPEKERLSLPSELTRSKSEAEEERRKHTVMMPNPYVPTSSSRIYPTVDRSSACALQPTDSSAATLAQRTNNENSGSSLTASLSHLVPTISSTTKSWWRHYLPSGNATTGGLNVGPTSSDGWDPADSELSSMGTSPNEEEMFHATVGYKKEQSILHSSLKNASAKAQQQHRSLATTGSSRHAPSKTVSENNETSTTGRTTCTKGTATGSSTRYPCHGATSVASDDAKLLGTAKLLSSSCL